jgi:hypothetical protein
MSSYNGKLFPQPAAGYTQSFWRTQPDPLDTHQTTPDLPSETDILIIGGGYVGASAAYRLLAENQQEPAPRVVLVEARELCSGATGRNGERTPRTRCAYATQLSLLSRSWIDRWSFETRYICGDCTVH